LKLSQFEMPFSRFGHPAWPFILRISGIISGVVTILVGLSACQSGNVSKMETITVGDLPSVSSVLIYIAENQGYFSENGLVIIIDSYESGVASMNAVLQGKTDIANMTEFVLVRNALQQQPVSIIGTMNRSLVMEMIGLRKYGVSNLSDLEGKRIGLTRGTITEFYLGRLLDLHGMSIKDVALVDFPQPEWLSAISSGDVAAIVGWPPSITQIKERFPNEAVSWQVQSEQPLYGILVARNDWIAEHPTVIARFWESLSQAEKFLIAHPNEAKAIVRTRLEYDDAYLESVWAQYNFSLSLDPSLVAAMEDEARWIMDNNLTTEKQVPNFLDYVYEDGLKTVKPEAVNIIR